MPRNHTQSHLVFRLLAGSLMIGLLVSAAGSAYFLRERYLEERSRIDQNIESFVKSQIPGIALSAYKIDNELLQEQLEGALRLPGIYWIAFHATGDDTVFSRSRNDKLPLMLKKFPLNTTVGNRKFDLGFLELGISYASAQFSLRDQLYEILWQTSLFVLGTALGITLLLHRGLIRHLRDLRQYLAQSEKVSTTPFQLKRPPSEHPDELDDLVDAVNTRDQTIRSLLDEERQLRKQILERQAHLDRMHYFLSHDLRQPLFTLDGCIGELSQEINLLHGDHLGDVRSLLALLKQSNQMLATRVNSLTRLFRIRNRDTVMEQLAPETMAQIVKSAIPKEHEKAFHLDKLPACRADHSVLFDVFSELLKNAIQYASPNRPLLVEISGHVREPWSEIIIEDNGIGMTLSELEKLDILFYKSNPQSPGVGIGIATSRVLMESIGGNIRFTARSGGGLCITLELPQREIPLHG